MAEAPHWPGLGLHPPTFGQEDFLHPFPLLKIDPESPEIRAGLRRSGSGVIASKAREWRSQHQQLMLRLTVTLNAVEPVPNEEIGQFVELAIRLPFITRTTGEWQTPPKSEGKIVQN